jgi:hypothetical protein
MTLAKERVDDVAADETGAAGDQDLHGGMIPLTESRAVRAVVAARAGAGKRRPPVGDHRGR